MLSCQYQALIKYNDDEKIESQQAELNLDNCLTFQCDYFNQDKILVKVQYQFPQYENYTVGLDNIILINTHQEQHIALEITKVLFSIINYLSINDRLSIITYNENSLKREISFTQMNEFGKQKLRQVVNEIVFIQKCRNQDSCQSNHFISGFLLAQDILNERRYINNISNIIFFPNSIDSYTKINDIFQSDNKKIEKTMITFTPKNFDLQRDFYQALNCLSTICNYDDDLRQILTSKRTILFKGLKIIFNKYKCLNSISTNNSVYLINNYLSAKNDIIMGYQQASFTELKTNIFDGFPQIVPITIQYFDVQKQQVISKDQSIIFQSCNGQIVAEKYKILCKEAIIETLAINQQREHERAIENILRFEKDLKSLTDNQKQFLKEQLTEVKVLIQRLQELQNFIWNQEEINRIKK